MRLTGVSAGSRTRLPPRLSRADERTVHIDREADDNPDMRAARASLADPACWLAVLAAGQRAGFVDKLHRPADQFLVEVSRSRRVRGGDVEPGGSVWGWPVGLISSLLSE